MRHFEMRPYRAPRPLYNFLSDADKKRFEVDFHYEDNDAMEEMGNQISILKRKKDRFPHLAMRVMDKMALFDQLRFQVSLGKWLRKEGKPSTNIEDRKIYERLRAFGRLGHFVPANAPKDWQAIPPENSVEGTENPAPWHLPTIEQFSPQYQISGNRIALKVLATNKPANWHKLSNFIPYPEKNKTMQRAKAMLFQADAILSTYELGALFFYQYLHKVKQTEDGQPWITDSAEKFIKNYIQRYQRFAQAVKSGDITPIETADFEKKIRRPFEPTSVKNNYTPKEFDELEDRKDKLQLVIDGFGFDLKVKDLPDAMREYLLGYQHDEGNSLKLKLIQRKKDTEKRLRQLRRAIEKIIEKEGTIPLSLSNQVLANFLAEDIMKWRPKDQKLERFAERNAKELGQLLIEFPHKKRDLEDLIYGGTKKIKRPRSMRLIDINYPFAHPFLNKVNPLDRKDLRDFYQQYLIQKKQWINRMLQPTGKKVPKPDAYFRKKMAQPARDIILKMELTAADTALQKVTDFLDHQTSFIGTATTIQNGELATYLADDLVFLKPKNMGKGVKNYDKPNNQEYKRLQSMLAMYSMDKIGLVDFMETLGLIGKGKPHTHPFLHLAKPAACTGIKTFYEAYLQAKIKWLDGLIENFKKEQQSITKHFGSFSRKPPKEINYAAMPMRLPRGLFNDAIQSALVNHTDLAIAEEDNFNRCIQKYVANDHQPFYTWYRKYEMEGVDDLPWKDDVDEWTEDIKSIKKEITNLEKKRERAGKRKPPLSEKEATRLRNSRRLKRKAQTNEQRIRYAQHTDRLLLLLLQELTTNKNEQQAFFINFKEIKLADIQPEDRNQKSQAIPAEDKVGQNTGNLLAKPIVMEITVGDKKVVDVLSIKRHGEFRRFFKDRRLDNLLKYYGDTTSQKAVLQDLLTYWQSMDTPIQTAMLIYLKSTPVQREKFKAETSIQADWTLFDKKWRDLTIHHFDKDTFEVEHLATLFNYLDNETVLRRHLLRELTYYDDNRDKIFEKIIAFEEAVHTQLGAAFQAALDKKTKNAHFLDHTSILKLVKSEVLKDKLSPDVMKELRLFRNKLAHNQLYFSPMLNGVLKGNSQAIVKDLMRFIEKTYEWLTQEVNGYTA